MSTEVSAHSPGPRPDPAVEAWIPATQPPNTGVVPEWSDVALNDPQLLETCTRWTVDESGRSLAHTWLIVQGMHCAACAGAIETAALKVQGVCSAAVSATAQRAQVCWDPTQTHLSDIVKAVSRAGYRVEPATAAHAEAHRHQERKALLWRLFVAAFCAMQVMMLATPSYVAEPGDLAPDLARLLNWGQGLLSLPVMLFSAQPFMRQAWQSIRRREIGMDVPVALGMIVMFGASLIATLHPWGPLGHEVVYDSLTMFASFLLAGRWIEMRLRHRAAIELEQLLRQPPRAVARIDEVDRVEWVMPSALQAGDRIRVQAGETFAVDGLILSGRTQVSESLMTGESLPQPRESGQQVMAGSLNLDAPVDLCVTRVGADTRWAQLVDLAERAALERPAWMRLADQWAGPFLWGVLSLAVLAGAGWWWIDPGRALWVAVAVLIVTCPCALSLAAPAARVAAARGFAREGVLLQRLDAIEDLARVDTMVFDKTGTLTQDRLQVVAVRPRDGQATQDILTQAAELAAWSRHPVALAIVEAARLSSTGGQAQACTVASSGLSEIREVQGQGMQALDAQGRTWRLGRPAWVLAGSATDPGGATVDRGVHPGAGSGVATVAWGLRGCIQGEFELSDILREDAPKAIDGLARQDVAVMVLSGDRAERVQAVASRLNIPVLGSAALPDEKRAAVAGLQARGRTVAMVGDGVNDAAVLAQAQVSVAMGHGSPASLARADVVILGDRLDALGALVRRARKARRLIRQNLAWSVAYNLSAIPLALTGHLPPWAAGLGMALSSLVVVLNSRRAAVDART